MEARPIFRNLTVILVFIFILPNFCIGDGNLPDDLLEDLTVENVLTDFVKNLNGTTEVMDGVQMSFLDVKENHTGIMNIKFNVKDMQLGFEGRGQGGFGGSGGGHGVGGGGGKDKKLLRRILPLFIMPFLIQSAILPMFLSTLKMMLIKSLLVGKTALLLIAINALRTSNAFKSRSEEKMANVHYGYKGAMEEYGSYWNR